MATVKGDVHDIGKNIVGVVLGCNNYEIIDLGVMVPLERILETAKETQADIIGLSGLITPSLDEMIYVAQEMERRKLKIPLLIGGATTSRIHTAVKIDPSYSGAVIHVLDASRSVQVVSSLMTVSRKTDLIQKTKDDYDKVREEYAGKKSAVSYVSLAEAQRNRFQIEWNGTPITKPAFLGGKAFHHYPLDVIRQYIDWRPFFLTWELRGRFPDILTDSKLGEPATALFRDAQELLDRIIQEDLLRANAVVGFFPANSVGDDIEIYEDDQRGRRRGVIHTLRQQTKKQSGQHNLALSDYIAPKESGIKDYLGCFVSTTGLGIEKPIQQFQKAQDDYNAIMMKALADRLAEAFAEHLHERVRKELWGYAKDETLTKEELIRVKYRGIRPAPGYPACPEHSEKKILFKLLDAEEKASVHLTENFAMFPASSVSGFYFAHREARYFAVGKLGQDQVEDYAKRKEMNLKEAEKWLSPYLSYAPRS